MTIRGLYLTLSDEPLADHIVGLVFASNVKIMK